jgi:hypothetical protein
MNYLKSIYNGNFTESFLNQELNLAVCEFCQMANFRPKESI